MGKTKAATFNLFFNYLFAIFTAVTGLILLPLYFHFFSIEVYGSWLACNGLATIFAVMEGGMSMIVTQRLAECYADKDKKRFGEVLGSGIILSIVFAIISLIGGLTVLLIFSHTLNIPDEFRGDIIKAVIINLMGKGGLTFVFLTLGAVPQVFLETIFAGIIGLIAYLTNIFSILVCLYLGFGVVSLGIGNLLFALVYILGYVIYIIKKKKSGEILKISFSKRTILELFKVSKNVIFANLSGIVGANFEPTIAAYFISPTATAILEINNKVIKVSQMFLDRMGTSVFAGLAIHIKSKKQKEVLSTISKLLAISLIASVCIYGYAVVFSKSIMTLWLGSTKYGGILLVSILAFNALMNSRKEVLTNISYAYGFISQTSKYVVVDSVVRVIFYSFLPVLLGLVGVPLAGTLGAASVVFLISRYFTKYLNLEFKSNVFINSGLRAGLLLLLPLVLAYVLEYNRISIIYLISESVVFFVGMLLFIFAIDRNLLKFVKYIILKIRV